MNKYGCTICLREQAQVNVAALVLITQAVVSFFCHTNYVILTEANVFLFLEGSGEGRLYNAREKDV